MSNRFIVFVVFVPVSYDAVSAALRPLGCGGTAYDSRSARVFVPVLAGIQADVVAEGAREMALG